MNVDWPSFKSAYEREIGRVDDPIDEKHADTHFYTLTLYKLLVPSQEGKGKYRLSLVAKNLCMLLADATRQKEYRDMLANLLLTNDVKGEIFKNFIQFVAVNRSETEIHRRFRSIPARTLIAWSKEAGLIETYHGRVQAIARAYTKPTKEEFWSVLLSTYKTMQRSEIFGIQKIYVPIGELRFNVDVKLGLVKSEFYKKLESLLSTKNGDRISFYGAPTDVLEEEETFEYSRRKYVYLAIKV